MRMTIRPVIALDPRLFGRRLPAEPAPTPAIFEELKLFGTTFAVGFLFVSVLIF